MNSIINENGVTFKELEKKIFSICICGDFARAGGLVGENEARGTVVAIGYSANSGGIVCINKNEIINSNYTRFSEIALTGQNTGIVN